MVSFDDDAWVVGGGKITFNTESQLVSFWQDDNVDSTVVSIFVNESLLVSFDDNAWLEGDDIKRKHFPAVSTIMIETFDNSFLSVKLEFTKEWD